MVDIESKFYMDFHDSMSKEWRDLNNEYGDADQYYYSGFTLSEAKYRLESDRIISQMSVA